MPKDPRRQLQGRMAKAIGQRFESRLDNSFDYYSRRGFAEVEKTPEPMSPIKNLGNGKFLAIFRKKAQVDYKGTVKGGRSVLFEAKFTTTDRIEQSRVGETQSDYMKRHSALGARCFVIVGFSSGNVYRIPWEVWVRMKEQFGRKYVMEADLKLYLVPVGWNGTLQLF